MGFVISALMIIMASAMLEVENVNIPDERKRIDAKKARGEELTYLEGAFP